MKGIDAAEQYRFVNSFRKRLITKGIYCNEQLLPAPKILMAKGAKCVQNLPPKKVIIK